MTTHTPEKLRDEFEKWKDDYGLSHEENYSAATEADCRAAFYAAWQAAHESFERGMGEVTVDVQTIREVADDLHAWGEDGDAQLLTRADWLYAAISHPPAQPLEAPCSFNEALNVIENWAEHGNTLNLPDDVMRFRALADRIAPNPAKEG